MVTGYNAQNLIRNRCKQFHTSPQFLHRGNGLRVAIRNGTLNRTVHQVTVEDAIAVLMILDICQIFHDALMITVRVCPMVVCHRHDFNFG